MVATEAIRCEDLSKHFGKFVALEGLSLSVEGGRVFGFLGPNGAGKTTTLRLFTDLTNPSAGRMWVAGEDVSGRSLRLRSKVGYLPESLASYGWMTGIPGPISKYRDSFRLQARRYPSGEPAAVY